MPRITSMTDTQLQLELAAIREGAAIFPLTDRAFLRITGPDATRWLNGMVTNSIQDLQPGQGNYNFLLNAQGRIQGDCTIYRDVEGSEPAFLLETDKSQIDTIEDLLNKFIIMDDVEIDRGLRIESSQTEPAPLNLVIAGPTAASVLLKNVEAPDCLPFEDAPKPGTMTIGSMEGNPVVILTPPKSLVPTFEIWCINNWTVKELYRRIEYYGMQSIYPEALEAFRILSATPRYGVDIRNTETNKDLPQETAQTHALHFAKGCYLGQEIVERIRSRGQVHRTFTQFRLTGSMPELPSKLEANGKPAGELTSAVQIGDEIVALGYARREALDTQQTLTYTGGTATQTTNH